MKVLRVLLVVVLVLALPLAASAKKAKTIDELAKMYDSTGCKKCHAEIYAQWEKSHHARSLMGVGGGMFLTPLAMKGKTPFSPDSPKKATLDTFPCFKCHLPQALTSAEDSVAAELAQALIDKDKKKVAKLNITCTVCHNNKAIIHKKTLGNPEKGVLYGTKDVAKHGDKVYKKVKKSAIIKNSIMCGQCHGLGPNLEFENPVQCATLYGSYQHNYLAQGGTQTCQDCHMAKIKGKADHLLAPNFNDIKGTSALLKKAISLDVQTLGYRWLEKSKDLRPMVVVNTKINSNAGHRVPDG
jgi:nitrate/TMAO reductase-like tetraheme cytochrome c subunit